MTTGYAIDLHTHSLRSDGALTPSELVRRAAARGVTIQALSDHDTLAGIADMGPILPMISNLTAPERAAVQPVAKALLAHDRALASTRVAA